MVARVENKKGHLVAIVCDGHLVGILEDFYDFKKLQ